MYDLLKSCDVYSPSLNEVLNLVVNINNDGG